MNDESIQAYLASQELFAGLDEDFMGFLAQHATPRRIASDEVLFRQGTHADKFYLVRAGRVSVEIPAIMGPTLEIQSLGADDVLGWSWLMPPYEWDFQARAATDSELLEFDGEALRARCEEDPRFGYELMKRFTRLMSERLASARQKMMDEWNPSGFA